MGKKKNRFKSNQAVQQKRFNKSSSNNRSQTKKKSKQHSNNTDNNNNNNANNNSNPNNNNGMAFLGLFQDEFQTLLERKMSEFDPSEVSILLDEDEKR